MCGWFCTATHLGPSVQGKGKGKGKGKSRDTSMIPCRLQSSPLAV